MARVMLSYPSILNRVEVLAYPLRLRISSMISSKSGVKIA